MNIELEREAFSFEAAKTLSLIFDRQDFSDVTLVWDDQNKIFAHKLILASASSLFRNIFHFTKNKCQVGEHRLQEFLEISKGLEIGGLANNEDIKVNKISNDINLEPLNDVATLLSNETGIFKNLSSGDT